MIAAIYARKSTDEGDRSEDAKSITRQVERAREYAARKGWEFSEAHVYQDDGVSGAEFKRRPGLQKLLAALSPRPAFDALIVSEQSRLGRDTVRTLATIQQIQDAGVRIFTYLDDREITLDDEQAEVLAFMGSWSSSSERRKASQRTSDALRRRAERGEVAGGKVYGYSNVREGSVVKRVVNEAEAAVVRRIFSDVAHGWGFLRIAKVLTAEGVPSPRGRWAVTTLRGMLNRDIYRGRLVYGATRTIRTWRDQGEDLLSRAGHRRGGAWAQNRGRGALVRCSC